MNDEYVLTVEASALFKEIQKDNDLYRSIIANNSFYIIKTDLEGNYTYINPYFCKRLNILAEDWLGKPSLGLIIPEDRKSCINTVIDCFAAPKISHWVMLRKPVANGVITTQWEFRMLHDELGIPSEVLCIGHDITSLIVQQLHERAQLLIKQEETVKRINNDLLVLNNELEERVITRTRALVESERRFRKMMETIPQIAWTNTLEGRVTFYNQRWYDYTGLDQQRVNVWGWKKTVHPDDLKLTLSKFRQIRKNYKGGEFEARFKNAEGAYRWHLNRLMPINNEEGDEELLWVGTATDIHELKLLQQRKDDFISIASHELKTPLTAMKISLQLLDEMKNTPNHKMLPKLIEKANKSLNNMTVLVENILNASTFNEGQLQVNSKQLNIFTLVDDSCACLPPRDKLHIKVEGERSLMVYADPVKINQVIVNLVNNAVKYAPDSHAVEVSIALTNRMVKVSIRDYGIGIPADKLIYLFERYYRVDMSEGHGSSLGLGLYICAEIIKNHSGEIGVVSEIGKGSTFWFTLPFTGITK